MSVFATALLGIYACVSLILGLVLCAYTSAGLIMVAGSLCIGVGAGLSWKRPTEGGVAIVIGGIVAGVMFGLMIYGFQSGGPAISLTAAILGGVLGWGGFPMLVGLTRIGRGIHRQHCHRSTSETSRRGRAGGGAWDLGGELTQLDERMTKRVN